MRVGAVGVEPRDCVLTPATLLTGVPGVATVGLTGKLRSAGTAWAVSGSSFQGASPYLTHCWPAGAGWLESVGSAGNRGIIHWLGYPSLMLAPPGS